MTTQELAIQEVLELELDYDQVILDFEQYGHIDQVLETESESFEFSITVEVNAANYGEFDNFSGTIEVVDIEYLKVGDEDVRELRLTKQIREQLKTVR